MTAMDRHLDASPEAGRAFVRRDLRGPLVMLNLLRFRALADYSAAPHLQPETPISGEEAYARYLEHTTPFLTAAGSEVVFSGDGGSFLIGPPDARWDRVLLVRHASVEAFLAFASDAAYLAGAGHRTAALDDSRLLPITESGR